MHHLNLILGITHLFTGSLVMLVCVPLIRGAVEPNDFCGFRFKESYDSDHAWYAINRQGGVHMAIWSAVLIVVGIALLLTKIEPGSRSSWVAVSAPLVLLVPAMLSRRFAKRYSAEHHGNGTSEP